MGACTGEPRPVEVVLPEGGTDTAAWTDAMAHAAALAESEERFRLAMDHSAVAMNITGPDGRFLRVNDAMTRLLGRARPDLLACTWQELTHPDDLMAGYT